MGSKEPSKSAFDLGPQEAWAVSPVGESDMNIAVSEVSAPAWLDVSSMYYRLAYENTAKPMPYAQSEWVMSPAALLTQRIRSALTSSTATEVKVGNAPPTVYSLRSELIEFEQIFDQPHQSRGVLRLRATLEGGGVWAQRTFAIEKAAPSADAVGGVRALGQCSDELAASIAAWVQASRSGSATAHTAQARAVRVESPH
jgi:cholesterol transport system auxiliary component